MGSYGLLQINHRNRARVIYSRRFLCEVEQTNLRRPGLEKGLTKVKREGECEGEKSSLGCLTWIRNGPLSIVSRLLLRGHLEGAENRRKSLFRFLGIYWEMGAGNREEEILIERGIAKGTIASAETGNKRPSWSIFLLIT